MNLFRAGLEVAYPGSQLSCSHTLTHASGVRKTSAKMHETTSHCGGRGGIAWENFLTPALSKPSTPARKGLLSAPRSSSDSFLLIVSGFLLLDIMN